MIGMENRFTRAKNLIYNIEYHSRRNPPPPALAKINTKWDIGQNF